MKKIIIFILLIYVLSYKFLLTSLGSLNQYIINPIIWIMFSILLSILYSKNKKQKYEQDIVYISITSSMIYIIFIYLIGIFVGYSKNPYSININSIIINFFGIILVTGLKEYVRWILQKNLKSKVFYFLIFIIFIMSDINVLELLKPINDSMDLLERIISTIIPVISINLLMAYLCNNGGYKPAILYRIIIILPTLIIPIFSKIDPPILTLINTLFMFFTYIVVRSKINKKEHITVFKGANKFNLKFWILPIIIFVTLIMFSLGAFPIKSSVIITQSMKPIINPGDLVIIEKCDINQIREQDIIQYKLNDYTIVHRVIKINFDKNQIITKGDNNNNIDKPVNKNQIIGKVRFKIPYIGYPTYIFKKLIGKDNIKLGD